MYFYFRQPCSWAVVVPGRTFSAREARRAERKQLAKAKDDEKRVAKCDAAAADSIEKLDAELHSMLTAVLSLSPTEASVERSFSVLKHVFRVNRSSAKDDSIIAQMRLSTYKKKK